MEKENCQPSVVQEEQKTKGLPIPEVGYICDRKLVDECARIDKIGKRSMMVHSLLSTTLLIKRLKLFPLRPASIDDLRVFHSQEYVDFLSNPNLQDEEEFGLGYDCPVLENMDNFVQTLAAGSLTAADLLLEGRVRVAINWSGGWHHAKRDSAAGFCYINDIVLAIHRLQRGFKRIMYVDLDVHHGDGVEDAFSSTDRVLTFSVHQLETGFFPGTGDLTENGFGRGKYYSVNIPLSQGCDDTTLCSVFNSVFPLAVSRFNPDAFVVQCGCDGLAGDPLGGFNLTPLSLSQCTKQVVEVGLPVLLLGGGGYNIPNSAKCWAKVTADILEVPLPEDIPDTDLFFLQYGPDYTFKISPGMRKNTNTAEYVKNLVDHVCENLQKLGT